MESVIKGERRANGCHSRYYILCFIQKFKNHTELCFLTALVQHHFFLYSNLFFFFYKLDKTWTSGPLGILAIISRSPHPSNNQARLIWPLCVIQEKKIKIELKNSYRFEIKIKLLERLIRLTGVKHILDHLPYSLAFV